MSNKICWGCGVELSRGVNIPPSRYDGSLYECKSCNSKRSILYRSKRKKCPRYPSGVYGLFRNHELVYVGEASLMWRRIYVEHFNYGSPNLKKSSIVSLVTRDNIDEWSWAYLKKEDDLYKRLVIESQYVTRHAPRLNKPYRDLPPNELKSLQVTLEQIDLGEYTLEDIEYLPSDKNKVEPDGVYIKRIGKSSHVNPVSPKRGSSVRYQKESL